ncbi:YbaB/EbfC family nucleoid-associated protein [Rhodococcus xishaensis]|uniref:YbaB/EbfC family DNA-binding protein n=1 Tax=Rhodococcus xishaensis TaxID=2487364 RepID=A0A438AR85_9NOCA|nr:YbaB/EbfC family nucleoid-associated protein [Rhodococcus xishaensis]RVW01197.1 YbaB/EbfC family DNA-binding protein [Rhodococcus xishaensis]
MVDNRLRDEVRQGLRNSNSALRAQVDEMLGALQTQTEALASAKEAVSRTTAEAESPDGLARVTVDAAGAVLSVWIDPAAFARTTPDRLAASVDAAARAATTDVRARVRDLMAPVTAWGADKVDLPDLTPGAPSVRNLVPTVATEFDPAASRQTVPDSDRDDVHDWRAPIMREAHGG